METLLNYRFGLDKKYPLKTKDQIEEMNNI